MIRLSPSIFYFAIFIAVPLARAEQAPNVLIVITDDQGYGDFSLHGNPHLQTPHFDSFARDGLRFENFHVSPFCAPTRASLLTGRYSLRTGAVSVTANREVMHEEEITLAEIFRDAGYATACIGKWHNGEQYPHNPTGQGFDEFFGFNGGHFNDYFDPVLTRGVKPESTEGYITDLLAEEAIRFMTTEREKPFFCYVSINAPHTPAQVPQRYFDKFKAKGLSDFDAAIYGMCENIDDNFGRILTALEESGQRDDTIILFLTDNGANGERYNAGMRGWKGSIHEGGTRVPLAIQWGDRLAKGSISQLAAHIDLLPTLIELADISDQSQKEIDGISLASWLRQPNAESIDRDVFVLRAFDALHPFPGCSSHEPAPVS